MGQNKPGERRENIASAPIFGAPTSGTSVADFSQPGITFQIGVAPVRIEICTQLDGITFDGAWPRRELKKIDGMSVPVLSRLDLITNKRATGLTQDLADVEALEALNKG